MDRALLPKGLDSICGFAVRYTGQKLFLANFLPKALQLPKVNCICRLLASQTCQNKRSFYTCEISSILVFLIASFQNSVWFFIPLHWPKNFMVKWTIVLFILKQALWLQNCQQTKNTFVQLCSLCFSHSPKKLSCGHSVKKLKPEGTSRSSNLTSSIIIESHLFIPVLSLITSLGKAPSWILDFTRWKIHRFLAGLYSG